MKSVGLLNNISLGRGKDGTAFNDYSYALQRHGDNRFFCKHFYEILVKNDFILYFLKFSMKYLFRQKNICIFAGDM